MFREFRLVGLPLLRSALPLSCISSTGGSELLLGKKMDVSPSSKQLLSSFNVLYLNVFAPRILSSSNPIISVTVFVSFTQIF